MIDIACRIKPRWHARAGSRAEITTEALDIVAQEKACPVVHR